MQEGRPERLMTALREYLSTPIEVLLQRHLTTSPEEAAVELFHSVATTVPAYQAFLQDRNIDPEEIQTVTDFHKIPPVTKENYIQRYPLADLCREGGLQSCDFIAVSSGSTGAPTFWPRFASDEVAIAARFEQIFYDSFHADTRPTLAVVCFALGTWFGGRRPGAGDAPARPPRAGRTADVARRPPSGRAGPRPVEHHRPGDRRASGVAQ